MVQELLAKVNVDPLEVLLKFAAGDWKGLGYESEVYHHEKADGSVRMGYVITPELRLQAAKEASQYLYPKKKEAEEPVQEEIDVTPEGEKQAAIEALQYIETKFPDLVKKDE